MKALNTLALISLVCALAACDESVEEVVYSELYLGHCASTSTDAEGEVTAKTEVTWESDLPVGFRRSDFNDGEETIACTTYTFDGVALQSQIVDGGCDGAIDATVALQPVADANVVFGATEDGFYKLTIVMSGVDGLHAWTSGSYAVPFLGLEEASYELNGDGLVETISFDANGNGEPDKTATLSYDGGQMKSVIELDASGEKTREESFEHDAMGNVLSSYFETPDMAFTTTYDYSCWQ